MRIRNSSLDRVREKEKSVFGFQSPRYTSDSPVSGLYSTARSAFSQQGEAADQRLCAGGPPSSPPAAPTAGSSSSSQRNTRDFQTRLAKSIEAHKARKGYSLNVPPPPGWMSSQFYIQISYWPLIHICTICDAMLSYLVPISLNIVLHRRVLTNSFPLVQALVITRYPLMLFAR